MENGKFILRGFSLHLNIDEIEVSIDHLSELENKISSEVGKKFCEEIKSKLSSFNPIYYTGTIEPIKNGDNIVVLPSENCVTNTDKLKYDERIDGITAKVVNVFAEENKVSIRIEELHGNTILRLGQTVVVHGHWIKKI